MYHVSCMYRVRNEVSDGVKEEKVLQKIKKKEEG